MKALVLGAGGYAGAVLLRILAHHPQIEVVTAAARSAAGRPIAELDPGLSPTSARTIAAEVADPAAAVAAADGATVVFSALPHGASAELCAAAVGRAALVVDLSADFRFASEERFVTAYGTGRPAPDLQAEAPYGLVEYARDALRDARLVANPGCYPTATLLPLLPVVRSGLATGTIVVSAMSGISGAGRGAKVNTLFAERAENVNAYSPGRLHRHAHEIIEQLRWEALVFTPHLIPAKQGMAVTTAVTVSDVDGAVDAIRRRYADEPFVTLTGETPPEARHVRGTNRCGIGWRAEGDVLILMSVIDNLWKGAAGQAVQAMNVRFGWPETAGLEREGDV